MIGNDELDDDYFTPVASTSLANIFGNVSHIEGVENEALKYVAPKQTVSKPNESKTGLCVYACALLAYEWVNNAYDTKGKLGFAIVKPATTGLHNIVLYDTNKITLSSTTISSNSEIVVRGDDYLSYYDNLQRYWSLYGTKNEVKCITEILKNLNAKIKYVPYTDKGPPIPRKPEKQLTTVLQDEADKQDKESDTDSSMQMKMKTSILSRMANMGKSILPPNSYNVEKSSDSSDASETNNLPKTTRHKAYKSIVKRSQFDKSNSDVIVPQHFVEQKTSLDTKHHENITLYTYVNGQLVPVTNTNVIQSTSANSDMNLFISEQRMSNSELRVNMNRVNDKVDEVLNKVRYLEYIDKNNSKTTNFQTDVLQKLLYEYETKIKKYEDLMKSKGIDYNNTCQMPETLDCNYNIELYKQKIYQLEQTDNDKDIHISKLQNELDFIKKEFQQVTIKKRDSDFGEEINNTKQQNLSIKNEGLNENNEATSLENLYKDNYVEGKIKNIMNDMYRAILTKFENHESYTGDNIKNILATVIKEVTIEILNDNKL